MGILNLKPNEEFDFQTFFNDFKNLLRNIPYRFVIIGLKGDLSLTYKELTTSYERQITDDNSRPIFEDELVNNLYALKTKNGCNITYEIWQLGKRISN